MFDYTLVDRAVDLTVRGFSPEQMIVFGSVARHEADDDSDIDMLVVMDTDVHPRYRRCPIDLRLRDPPVDRDVFVATPEESERGKDDEYPSICEIVRTGYVAYRRPEGPPA